MIFLIEYKRGEGRIISFREFEDSQRREAERLRIGLELDLNRNQVDHEVVLLEAQNEEALHRTHQRYFADLRQIIKSVCE